LAAFAVKALNRKEIRKERKGLQSEIFNLS
jgi:hypothetical protein